jgi:hypothetical protein
MNNNANNNAMQTSMTNSMKENFSLPNRSFAPSLEKLKGGKRVAGTRGKRVTRSRGKRVAGTRRR